MGPSVQVQPQPRGDNCGVWKPGRGRLLACQKLVGNMVWREWLLQDQAWDRTLRSWLTSLHLCLLCCLKTQQNSCLIIQTKTKILIIQTKTRISIIQTKSKMGIIQTKTKSTCLEMTNLNTTAQCIQILGIYKDKRNQDYSVFHIFIQHALIEMVLSILPTEGILYMKDSPRMFEAPGVYISSR